MLIGYARASRQDQDAEEQIAALKRSGCNLIFQEMASRGRWGRPELHRLLDRLRKGDVVVVWKLDRLSGSLKDLLIVMERIDRKQAGFRSLNESIDTNSPGGRMMMRIIKTFAESEREMLRERTRVGLDSAREQGRVGGPRPKLTHHEQQQLANMVNSGDKSAADAARFFNVHPSTVSRLLKRHMAP